MAEGPTGRIEPRSRFTLHSVAGPAGTMLDGGPAASPYGELSPLVGPFPRLVARVSGPERELEEAARGLPSGAAKPEALAVRLRRAGAELSWGPPDALPDTAAYLRLCHERGASSVELVRADPTLLTEMQIGAFFHAYWRRRVARLAALRLGLGPSVLRGRMTGMAADVAFWAGVRSRATPSEWERFARSSYVVFYYHRIGERGKPGEERLDVHPRRFERQLRLLRALRFRPLTLAELVAFHTDPEMTLPRRSFVISADDGFQDAVVAFNAHADVRPVVFVNTSAVGGRASWAYEEPLAGWQELKELEDAGGVVASHCRGHPRLPELDDDALDDELAGSLAELREQLPQAPGLFAYPHGLHDERVRARVLAAGYDAAFTTQPGRNGAGTDPYCLRRIGLKDWDGAVPLLWKATTGELLPWIWERARRRLRGSA
ncbi:MAG TPA: polysaccharide deacetylase family protein [Gaiellaceae bacterium]|nr:polysaccharide deacetylase family protein [Gaiellaceae bacterium]